MTRSASVEVGDGAPPKGETKVRRCHLSPDHVVERPRKGNCQTMADVLSFAAKTYGSQKGFGYRNVIKVHNEEKEVTKTIDGKEVKETKKWQLYELSDYTYLTYNEFDALVTKLSSGLASLGLNHTTRFNIYGTTSYEWQATAHACFRQNITFCTAYETLGEDGLQHSLAEPEAVGIFTNPHLLDMLTSVVERTPTVKHVIVNGEPEEAKLEALRAKLAGRPGATVTRLSELVKRGEQNPVAPNLPQPEDVACIMYTSGSTGAPKGVILTHSNLIGAVGGVETLLGPEFLPGDTFLAYLPLAHILEFIVECCVMYLGMTIGYGGVKTLTSASTKNCKGDLQLFAPSIMVGVPAVWEQVRKGIVGKVNGGPAAAKYAFWGAMAAKRNKIPILSGLADAVVFKKVREQTGGRMRLALSGGAAISRDTQEFLDTALVRMLQGYGLTETCGMCAVLTPEFWNSGVAGVPVPAVEVKLRDVPDAGYFCTNLQGEVCLRGPAVFKGYYKRDDLNKESFEDGWFLTGDIGQWNKDGTLSIIDRKKNLVKLSGGEYIALEKLESTYKSSELVQNICVVGDPNARQPMAVVFPREDNFKALAKANGAAGVDDLEALCRDRKLASAVRDELNKIGRQNKFKTMEMLGTVLLVSEELSMTAAQKLERKKVQEKYAAEIKKIYP